MAVTEAAFAAVAHFSPMPVETGTYTYRPNYFKPDPSLDYVLQPGARVTSKKVLGNKTIYDVTYTVDSAGHRVTKGNPLGPTWLFMGCSYTVGEGVQDNQTLPSFFSADLGGTQNVVNLAVNGYGAHQMLRILETDRLAGVHVPVKQVIYQGIWWHVRRSAGHAVWDKTGPRYVFSGDSVVYAGPLHGRLALKVFSLLSLSDVATYFMMRFYFDAGFTDRELEIYARIIERSARIARQKLGSQFTILFWDDTNSQSQRILSRLQKTGIPVILVSNIIPRDEWMSFMLPVDHHPAPAANRRIAAYLAARLGARTNPDN